MCPVLDAGNKMKLETDEAPPLVQRALWMR